MRIGRRRDATGLGIGGYEEAKRDGMDVDGCSLLAAGFWLLAAGCWLLYCVLCVVELYLAGRG